MLHVHYTRDDILLLLANSYPTRTTLSLSLTLEFVTTTVFDMIYDVLVRPMVTSPSRFDSSVVTFGMDSTANYIVMSWLFIRALHHISGLCRDLLLQTHTTACLAYYGIQVAPSYSILPGSS